MSKMRLLACLGYRGCTINSGPLLQAITKANQAM